MIAVINEEDIINSYIGLPYRHQGRDRTGVDCWGIIVLIYRDFFSVNIFDVDEYERNFAIHGGQYFDEYITREWSKIQEPQPLAVVLFKNGRGITDHAGICLSRGRYLEATRHGVVVSRLSDKKQTIEGFYRHVSKAEI